MRTNQKMKLLTEHLDRGRHDRSQMLDGRLVPLLARGLARIEDCVVLVSQENLAHAKLDDFTDETGYECFVNHVHVTDYIDTPTNGLVLLEQGIALARKLAQALSDSSMEGHFRIIISFDESECTVRFHKIRRGQNWLSADLEKYEEAIGILDT